MGLWCWKWSENQSETDEGAVAFFFDVFRRAAVEQGGAESDVEVHEVEFQADAYGAADVETVEADDVVGVKVVLFAHRFGLVAGGDDFLLGADADVEFGTGKDVGPRLFGDVEVQVEQNGHVDAVLGVGRFQFVILVVVFQAAEIDTGGDADVAGELEVVGDADIVADGGVGIIDIVLRVHRGDASVDVELGHHVAGQQHGAGDSQKG